MQLFELSGNTNVEGVETTNACYGGTSALLNAIALVHSLGSVAVLGRSFGRLVICGDIVVYTVGPAKPTGGAGCNAYWT